MSKRADSLIPGKIVWNELVARDESAAGKFYNGLFGWKSARFAKGVDYTLFKHGKKDVGGMMQCPGPDNACGWVPYVTVTDVDKTIAKGKKLGAQLALDPFDVPNVGRIAVLVDPHGAAIGIITPRV